MRAEFYPMSVPTAATGVGSSFSAAHFMEKSVQVSGSGTWTLNVEGSMDDLSWVVVDTISGPACIVVSQTFKSLRINVTAWSSGQPVATFGGFQSHAS